MRKDSPASLHLPQQLLRCHPEQLCQRHQIRGAGIGRTALPLGHRLPADAQCLRHKFLRHLARRPAFFQHLAQRPCALCLLLPDRFRPNVLSQRLDQQHDHIHRHRQDRQGHRRQNKRNLHCTNLLSCGQYTVITPVAPPTITQFFGCTALFYGQKNNGARLVGRKTVKSPFYLYLTLFSYKLICHVRQIAHFLDKSLTLIVLKHERNAACHTKKFKLIQRFHIHSEEHRIPNAQQIAM